MKKNFPESFQTGVDIINQKISSFSDHIQKTLYNERWFLCYGILISILMWGMELALNPIGMDDEEFIFMPGIWGREWCTQGRFSAYLLLQRLFDNPFVPYFALLLSCFFLLAAFEILFPPEKEKNTLRYLMFPIFTGCSSLAYEYQVSCLAGIFGIGVFLSAVSCQMAWKGKVQSILSLIAGTFALGCYQAFVSVLVVLHIFKLLKKNQDARFNFKDNFKAGLSALLHIGVVLLLYTAVNKIVLSALNMQFQSATSRQFEITDGFNIAKIAVRIRLFLEGHFYFESFYLIPVFMAVCLLCIAAAEIYKKVKKNQFSISGFLFETALYAVLLLAPFFLLIASGGKTYLIRTLIAFPTVLVVLLYFAWHNTNTLLRSILTCLTIVMCVKFCYINTAASYRNYLAHENDKRIAADISTRLMSQSDSNKQLPIFFAGPYRSAPVKNYYFFSQQQENMGSSLFMDPRNELILRFLNTMGIFHFRHAAPEEIFHIYRKLPEMPCYPAKDSVKVINGIGVVKFSDSCKLSLKYGGFPEFHQERYLTLVPPVKKHAKGVFMTTTDNPAVGKAIWQGSAQNIAGNRDVHISHKNYFPLKTQGLRHDPQLSFKHLPKTQADTICLRIKCTSAQTDTFQIYFKTEDPANPGKKVIGYVVIKVWPGRNDIALVFPSSILKNDFFRVDPGSQGSSFIFENITLNEYLEEENIQNVEKN